MASLGEVQEKKGLWEHVLSCTPVPEREELAAMVGRALIAKNEVTIFLACCLVYIRITNDLLGIVD